MNFIFTGKNMLIIIKWQIFVDTDSDIQLARRCKVWHKVNYLDVILTVVVDLVQRDIFYRGRDVEGVLDVTEKDSPFYLYRYGNS